MGTTHHRLPRDRYRGRVSAAFTLCVQDRRPLFSSGHIFRCFADFLRISAENRMSNVVFCFMPDHVHLILMGISDSSDLLSIVEDFKQRSGYIGSEQTIPDLIGKKAFMTV